MLPDPVTLAGMISSETGLEFSSEAGADENGHQWIVLRPSGYDPAQTFGIKVSVLWRRLKIEFLPGKFARPLLARMSAADADGRSAFRSVVADCLRRRASVELRVNGLAASFDSEDIWGRDWLRFSLALNRGNLELGIDEGRSDFEIVSEWTHRFAAAVLAILPLEATSDDATDELPSGFSEGAETKVLVNRYERDRRNRAAALAIHGTRCKACNIDFGERYGAIAAGFIEVHHLTPVSQLGPAYVINADTDLVPLCANCHRVAHRSDPPMSVAAVAAAMKSAAQSKT